MENSELMNSLINELQKIDSSIESLIDFDNIINLIKNKSEEAIKILFKTITDEEYECGFIHDDIILELSNFYLKENNTINARFCLGMIRDKTNQSFISKCLDIVERYSNLLAKKHNSIGKCCFELLKHYPENIDIFADHLNDIQNIIYTKEIGDYLTEFQKFIGKNEIFKSKFEDLENKFKNFKNEINNIVKNDNCVPLNSLYNQRDKSDPNIFIVDNKETMKSIIKSYFSLASKAVEYVSSNDSMQPKIKDSMLDMIIMKIVNTINNIRGDFSEVNGNNGVGISDFNIFYSTIRGVIGSNNGNYFDRPKYMEITRKIVNVFTQKGDYNLAFHIFDPLYRANKKIFKEDYKKALELQYNGNKNDHHAAEFYLDFLIEENLYESIDELKNILIELKKRIELLGKDNPNYNATNIEIVRTFDKIAKQFSKKEEKEDISELKEMLDSFADLYEGGIKYVGKNNTKNVYDYIIGEQKFFEEYWKLIENSSKSGELELFDNFVNMIKEQGGIDIPEYNIVSFLSNVESIMIEESKIKHGSDIKKIEQSLSINGLVEYFNKLCTKKNVNEGKIKEVFNYIINKTSEIDGKEVPNTDRNQITLFLANLLNKNEIDLSLIEDNKEILKKLVGNAFSIFVEQTIMAKRNLVENIINNKKLENKEKIEDIEQIILESDDLEDNILAESINNSIDKFSSMEEEKVEKTFP